MFVETDTSKKKKTFNIIFKAADFPENRLDLKKCIYPRYQDPDKNSAPDKQ